MRKAPILIVLAVLAALVATAYSQMVIMSSTLGGPPILSCPVGASCIYFSQTGSDSTGDGSMGNPYKSVAKMETLFTGLTGQAGTHFLFNGASGTWNEEIDIGTFGQKGLQGIAGNPVVISSYNGQALFDEQNQNPYCVNAQIPSSAVNYVTVNNIACTRAEHQGISFQGLSGNLQNITITNNLVYDTGPGCGHISNSACVGIEDETTWTTRTAYVGAASCSNSNATTSSCGWVNSTGAPTAARFMLLTASCTSGTSAPAWPSTRGAIFTETTTGGTTKCQWENMGVVSDYDNQINFYDNTDNVHNATLSFNTVKWCGGHNCFELDGDTGQPVAQGNHVGPGCQHVCLDEKLSGNYNAGGVTVSILNPLITWPGNVSQVVNNFVQCGFSLTLCGGGATKNSGSDLYFGQNAGRAAGAVNPDWVWQGNVGWDAGGASGAASAGIAIVTSGASCSGGGPCPVVARIYNNTFYSSPSCGAGCFGFYDQPGKVGLGLPNQGMTNSQVDLRNNIFDGFGARAVNVVGGMSGTTGGVTTKEDYNNFGGAQGINASGISFNGSTTPGAHDWCASGCGTRTNINPTYVSASELTTADFRLLLGSPMLGVGFGGITDATSNIGFYFGTGQ